MPNRQSTREGKTRRVPRLVVGLRVGSESLDSLATLLSGLPKDTGLTLVALVSADDEQLAQLASGMKCPLPVQQLSETTRLRRDAVYLAGDQGVLEMNASTLHVAPRPPGGAAAPADHFFSSLADHQRQHSIGIVLAGGTTDGLLGLKAISDAGGMTIVESASQSNGLMLSSANINSSGIDHVLPIGEIAIELGRYALHHRSLHSGEVDSQLTTQIIESIPSITESVQRHTDHNFRHYKTTTLVRRIKRRMHVLKCASVQAYIDVLSASRDEATRLFRDLLISVTAFFRDPEAFRTLEHSVIPKLLQKHPDGEPVRVWVPGCATGEEAYSLAIVFREAIEKLDRPIGLQIFATDLDERALQIARQGSYSLAAVEDIPPERLKRFFFKRGLRYLVNKELRDCVVFSSHNLISDPPFTKLDLISCRNLLIYLGSHLQKKLIPLFHYALRPAGYLFLGPSESMSGHKELFRTVSAKHRISQRKATSIAPDTRHSGLRLAMGRPTAHADSTSQPQVDLHQIGQRIALDEFAAQWAIVDEDAQILSLSADTSPFLKLAEGSFQNNIIKMLPSSIRFGVRAAFAEAKEKKRQIVHDNLTLHIDQSSQRVVVTVQPMPQVGEDSGLYFIAFQLVGKPVSQAARELATAAESGSGDSPDARTLLEQLERELASTREDLERTVHELETANEELKSSNEELISMNEELQSANEELESSKEDVQASNDALARINSDLENLLRSTDVATIFLDREGNIRGFTPAIKSIYGLITSDIGRPLAHLSPHVANMPKLPDTQTLLASPQPIEDTIQTLDGRWFIRRVLAYSTADNQCDGLVVTFVDVTELRKSEKRLKAALHGGCVSAWEINLRTKEVWRTAGHDQLFGYAEDLPVWNLETFLQHVVPEQVEAVRQKFDQCMETFDDWSLECEIIRTDGQRRWLFARGLPAGDLHGNPTRMYGTIGDVTERKRSEHALTESEAHLRRIIDNMLGFVGVLDVSGVLLDANEAALQVGGVTREMVIGKPFWECDWWVHDPRQVQRLKASIEKARGGQAVRYDARVQTAGGGLIDIDFMLVPAHNDQGQITHLIPSAVDITPRKKALEALQESEAFNRSILESSGDCIKVLDLDGRLISINDSGLRALEVDDVAQIQGEPLTSLWPQEDHSVVVAAYEAAVAGGVGHFVGQCPTAKGTLKWWDVLITPILGDNGKPERLLSISRDITQSRTMEQAIQESEMRFQTLADHMAQLAWMADPSGNITWYNQRWFEYTGTTLEEVEGWGWERCHHPDHLQRVTVKFKHALDNGLLWEDTFPLRGKDGTYRWFLSRAMPIRDASGQIIRWFGTNTDISDRIRIEAELEEARRLAEAANQAKSDFLANMSHEIRTPMTAILGFAELLKVSDEAEGEKVETIRRNGQFLLELINDILDLSKIEAGKIEIDVLRFSPSKLVEDVCSLMHLRAVESNLDLKVEYVGLIPDVIENDPIRVRQILINLVGNAIKFTHEGSIRLRLSFSPEDRMLRFDVIDTGIGISDELQAKLFRPFEQGDSSIVRRYGGSGLGLAISQRLAQVLGGRIDFQSQLGGGSTFSLSIEVAEIEGMQLIHYQTPEARWTGRGQPIGASAVNPTLAHSDEEVGSGRLDVRVLIVDDRRDIRFLTQHFVRQVGGEVLLAENGKEALAIVEQERAAARPLDIILMDVQMPEMDGLTATRHLRSEHYAGPIIALTANAMDSDRQACLDAGYTDYLSKPIDATQLIDMLRKYAKSSTRMVSD